jgi:hypothetical protein
VRRIEVWRSRRRPLEGEEDTLGLSRVRTIMLVPAIGVEIDFVYAVAR